MFIQADIQPELSVLSSYNATKKEEGERVRDDPLVNLGSQWGTQLMRIFS